MERKKVCLILPQALPVPAVRGGAVEALAESIAKHNELHQELDLTIVSMYDEQAYQKSKDYKETKWIYIKKTPLDVYTDYLFRLVRRITKKSFAIGTYDRRVLKLLKNQKFDRIVFEGGNVFFASRYKKYFDKDQILFHYHCIFRPSFSMKKCVAGTIGISQYVTQEFMKSSDLKQRNYTLLNGIDLKRFDREATKEELSQICQTAHIEEDDFVLLYVGRVIDAKGVKECAQAVESLSDQNVKLIIAGEGTGFNSVYIRELEEIAGRSGGKVTMVGYVPNDELYRYYQVCDCVLMPSTCEEGAGLVQSEAYASGKPVIVTDRGGIPEYRINEASIEISVEPDFVGNLQKAITEMKQRVCAGEFDPEWIKDANKRFSDEQYYLNFVEILKRDIQHK